MVQRGAPARPRRPPRGAAGSLPAAPPGPRLVPSRVRPGSSLVSPPGAGPSRAGPLPGAATIMAAAPGLRLPVISARPRGTGHCGLVCGRKEASCRSRGHSRAGLGEGTPGRSLGTTTEAPVAGWCSGPAWAA